ncbi:MAG: SAM-dependent methyltransferase, partial [Deltaproteobacteria bacterium]|nr:SAM-dependent methyltransferase [Deltaproteobacteria bacterium]
IDIDPERIRESQANASSAGVADRVKFIEADLFKTDVSQASVVALYLLPQLNLRLRPQLFKELKPGTRIVSHNFDMDDWRPDVSERLGNSLYYLWILPADVAGLWNVKLSMPKRPDMNYAVQLTQSFQELEGEAVSEDMDIDISDLKIKGDKVSFLLSRKISQLKVDMYFKGQVKGNSISGNAQVEGGLYEGLHSWTAVRNK